MPSTLFARLRPLLDRLTGAAAVRALARANEDLRTTAALIRDTLASVDETFLLLSPDGRCFASPTPHAGDILGAEPEGRHLGEILDLAPHEREDLAAWLRLLGRAGVSFETVRELGPAQFTNHLTGLTYRVRYFPMRADGRLENIIVTLLDVTDTLRARAAREAADARADFVLAVAKHRTEFKKFTIAVRDVAARTAAWPIDDLRRELHTLKGTAGIFFATPVVRSVHEFELELTTASELERPLIRARLGTELPRVLTEFLAVNAEILSQLRVFEDEAIVLSAPTLALARLAFAGDARDFDAVVAGLGCREVGEVVMNFAPHVTALGERLGKRARLELDPSSELCGLAGDRYDDVLTGLVHLFNNAVDHGIEDAATRAGADKSAIGLIRVRVGAAGPALEIRITDDGGGIDPAALRRAPGGADLADDEVLQSIFTLGVTTRATATETSGLGVGLSGLHDLVRRHGGTLRVESTLGRGTTFTLRLPVPADQIFFARPARAA